MASHPDLAAEQAYIDNAYASLERSREEATRLRSMVEVGKGGTEQARWEREMIEGNIAQRLASLQLGDASLVFGRIDRTRGEGGDSYYIGRLAVSDEHREPLVVDWRAPVAEPFYRATGRQPMGLRAPPPLRHPRPPAARHRGRAVRRVGRPARRRAHRRRRGPRDPRPEHAHRRARGGAHRSARATSSPRSRASRTRSSGPTSPACSSCRAAPAPARRSSPSTAPPTSSTPTGSRSRGRACSSSAPTGCSSATSSRCCPSLGEAGVELAVLADLLDGTHPLDIEGRDHPATARVKGDLRMAKVLAKAVHDRQRPLRRTMRVGYGLQTLSLTPRPEQGDRRRRQAALPPPQRRAAGTSRRACSPPWPTAPACRSRPHEVRERLRHAPEVREALERMWPVLTPADLLHDLFGSPALDRAGRRPHAVRRRAGGAAAARAPAPSTRSTWTVDDVPLLDEARALLGPKPRRRRPGQPARRGGAHLRPHRGGRGAGPLARCSSACSPAARSTAR